MSLGINEKCIKCFKFNGRMYKTFKNNNIILKKLSLT